MNFHIEYPRANTERCVESKIFFCFIDISLNRKMIEFNFEIHLYDSNMEALNAICICVKEF